MTNVEDQAFFLTRWLSRDYNPTQSVGLVSSLFFPFLFWTLNQLGNRQWQYSPGGSVPRPWSPTWKTDVPLAPVSPSVRGDGSKSPKFYSLLGVPWYGMTTDCRVGCPWLSMSPLWCERFHWTIFRHRFSLSLSSEVSVLSVSWVLQIIDMTLQPRLKKHKWKTPQVSQRT